MSAHALKTSVFLLHSSFFTCRDQVVSGQTRILKSLIVTPLSTLKSAQVTFYLSLRKQQMKYNARLSRCQMQFCFSSIVAVFDRS